MDFRQRLWRVLRGASHDFKNVDPDRILREAGHTRSRQQATASQSKATVPDELAKAYARLELPPGSSAAEAKSAWRRLMSQYHPDRFANDERKQVIATEVAAALTDAYQRIRTQERPAS